MSCLRITRSSFCTAVGLFVVAVAAGEEPCEWNCVSPQAVLYHKMVFDEARAELVVFGGAPVGQSRPVDSNTYLWNGQNWSVRSLELSPSPRRSHAMCYAAEQGLTYLYGGQTNLSGNNQFVDTWTWNGNAWSLLNENGPAFRGSPQLAYDSARDTLVLHGRSATENIGETWEWDGAQWLLRSQAGPRMAAFGICYDTQRAMCICVQNGLETWGWDGTTWTVLEPRRSQPAPDGTNVVFDSQRNAVLCFATGPSPDVRGVWSWTGEWARLTSQGPAQRVGLAMAYRSLDSKLVIFGGMQASSPPSGPIVAASDIREWDGDTWLQTTGQIPHASIGKAAFDRARGVTVYVAPTTDGSFGPWPLTTWEWSQSGWQKRVTEQALPETDAWALEYDDTRNSMLLYTANTDGQPAQLWSYDGVDWTLLDSSAPAFYGQGSGGPTMAVDATRGTLLLWHGHMSEWNGVSWSLVRLRIDPQFSRNVRLVFDVRRQLPILVVHELFGSLIVHEPDPTEGDWYSTALPISVGISEFEAVYDRQLGVTTILTGGDETADPRVWQWDGRWLVDRGAAQFAPRAAPALAYDSERGKHVLFGGNADPMNPWSAAALGDTWEWNSAAEPTLWMESESRNILNGALTSFECRVGGQSVALQWRRDGVPLDDGLSPNGSVITGAQTNQLTIDRATTFDAGEYDLVAVTACGQAISDPVQLTVNPPRGCPADLDGDGAVLLADLAALLSQFGCDGAAAGCFADIDGNGLVELPDLALLLIAFGADCP